MLFNSEFKSANKEIQTIKNKEKILSKEKISEEEKPDVRAFDGKPLDNILRKDFMITKSNGEKTCSYPYTELMGDRTGQYAKILSYLINTKPVDITFNQAPNRILHDTFDIKDIQSMDVEYANNFKLHIEPFDDNFKLTFPSGENLVFSSMDAVLMDKINREFCITVPNGQLSPEFSRIPSVIISSDRNKRANECMKSIAKAYNEYVSAKTNGNVEEKRGLLKDKIKEFEDSKYSQTSIFTENKNMRDLYEALKTNFFVADQLSNEQTIN